MNHIAKYLADNLGIEDEEFIAIITGYLTKKIYSDKLNS